MPAPASRWRRTVREVAVKAAKAFESAGAVITEIDGVMTREMLDGLDHFWRARMWDDLSKLTPAERAKALPYILNGRRPARSSRVSTSSGVSMPPWRSGRRRQNCSARSIM